MKQKKQRPNYSIEVRERAVRLVREHLGNYPSRWATIESIAGKTQRPIGHSGYPRRQTAALERRAESPDCRKRCERTVIIPFLSGRISGLHAASFSFMAGVMPPMPMFGRSLL